MYIIEMNGDKVKSKPTFAEAFKWANRFCSGNVRIYSLTETTMPKANKESGEYVDERSTQAYGFHPGVCVRTIA